MVFARGQNGARNKPNKKQEKEEKEKTNYHRDQETDEKFDTGQGISVLSRPLWPIVLRPSGATVLPGPYLADMEETRVSWKLDIFLVR